MAKLTGTNPEQVPTNADLGTMAYQDKDQIKVGTIESTTESGAVLLKTGDDQYSSVLVGKRPFGDNFANIEFDAGQPNGVVKLEAEGSGNLKFFTANNVVMAMLSSGNVGIGTQSPTQKLDVNGVVNVGDGNERLTISFDGSARINNKDNSPLVFSTSNTQRMSIESNGEVKIATGLLELDGNDIGGTQVTIADDAVASITPPRKGGFMFVTANGASDYPTGETWSANSIYYDVGASLSIQSRDTYATNVEVTTSDVTGTTGTDAKITVAAQTGVIKIENRAGGSITFQVTFL